MPADGNKPITRAIEKDYLSARRKMSSLSEIIETRIDFILKTICSEFGWILIYW